MSRQALALVLLLCWTFPLQSRSPDASVEQSLAGVRVGDNTRAQVVQMYRTLRRTSGVDYVQVGSACELTFFFDDADGKKKPVRVVSIRRLLPEKSDSKCDSLATGAGLKFGDSIQRIKEIYGEPVVSTTKGDIEFLRYDNYDASNSKKQKIMAKDFMIRWSKTARKIVEMEIDASPVSCDEILSLPSEA